MIGSGTVTITGDRAAAAAGTKLAADAACDVLAAGGNVVDAAIAASAVLCVVLPHAVAIGGDLFALVRSGRDGRVTAVNATGGAPEAAEIATFRGLGHRHVPLIGPLSIQPPGLVAGWQTLRDRWGSQELDRLLAPAIELAQHGFPTGERLARFSADLAPDLQPIAGWADCFAPGGTPLTTGATFRQERLAATLRRIAVQGAAGFYTGPVAGDLVNTVRDAGGILSLRDLECVTTEIAEPLSVTVRGFRVHTQPPISQGVILLRALGMVDRLFEKDVPQEALWPAAAEALRQAFAERLALLGDGAHPRRPDGAASPRGRDEAAGSRGRDEASGSRGRDGDTGARGRAEAMLRGDLPPSGDMRAQAHDGRETTTLAVTDREGNTAALIQSVFADFGSGVVGRDSGVLLNNRLSALFLDPFHPNGLRPGRRTMHTLHNFIAVDADGRVRFAGGSPGGDNQPQVNLQFLSRVIFLGEQPRDAIAAARFAIWPGTTPTDAAHGVGTVVKCETAMPESILRAFSEAGFSVAEDASIGSLKLVGETAQGLTAWADTRREGAVAAL